MLTSDAWGDDTAIPSFPSTKKRIFVYTASCGIWLRCSFKLPSEIEYVCDTPWNADPPDYSSISGRWVDHWRWHSCGQICCKKVYEISQLVSGVIEIQSKTKSSYADDEECSDQGVFWGRRPTPDDVEVELPCEDGC